MKNSISEQTLEKLENDLQEVNSVEYDQISKTETAVGICSSALLELRDFVNHQPLKQERRNSVF